MAETHTPQGVLVQHVPEAGLELLSSCLYLSIARIIGIYH